MEVEKSENKLLNYIKGNYKIFSYFFGVIVLLSFLSIWFFQNNESKKVKIAEDYIKAQVLIENGNNLQAKEILTQIISKKNSPYSSLSLFLIIENDLIAERSIIVGYFNSIIDNNNFKKEDLNLIKLKKAIYISDIANEQEIISLLNPIINSNSVWRSHSIQFLVDYYIYLDQPQKAKQYSSLLDKENEISK